MISEYAELLYTSHQLITLLQNLEDTYLRTHSQT